jgi:hypothetical protein
MLASIAAQNTSTAQLFFLVALIVGIIAVVFGLVPSTRPYAWAIGVLALVVLVFMSAGLLVAF